MAAQFLKEFCRTFRTLPLQQCGVGTALTWDIPTAKINGVEYNPLRWPDGSYSIQGAAAVLGVTAQTVFKWLNKGRLHGRQLAKGQPWQIDLVDEEIGLLKAQVRRTTPSRRTAS